MTNRRIMALNDISIDFNGDTDEPYFDLCIHDDELPINAPSIIASVSLSPDDMRELSQRLAKCADLLADYDSLTYRNS